MISLGVLYLEEVFHDILLFGRCFRGSVMDVLEYSSAVWYYRLLIHTIIKLMDLVVSGASFLTGVCLSVTLHFVNLWQYYVFCTRSGVTQCTTFKVLYLRRMCRCGLHAALWSHHIGTLMRLLAVEPRTAGLLLPCQYICGTIWVTPYSMV